MLRYQETIGMAHHHLPLPLEDASSEEDEDTDAPEAPMTVDASIEMTTTSNGNDQH